MQGIAALQPYVIAAFLIWAALMKLLGRQLPAQAGQSALARLIGPARAIPAFRLVAAVELAVAAALLATPVAHWTAGTVPGAVVVGSGVAAVLLCLGFLAYLTYAAVAAPTSSCGCLGAHSRPVEWRTFARAGLLLALSLTACWATPPLAIASPSLMIASPATPAASPYSVGVLLVGLGLVEVAVLVALSPELDRRWLLPLRRLMVRLRNPLTPPPAHEIPLEVSLRTLYRSPAYCSASALLTSDLQDAWDEDGLRFATYAATPGKTAVFAIPLTDPDPRAIRVALVPEPAPT